jgi:hypothetical protein
MENTAKKNLAAGFKLFRMPDLDTGKRWLLFLFILVELALIGVALWPACWLMLSYAPRADTPLYWTVLIIGAILLFNYTYLITLLVLRIAIPKPKEGFYPRQPDGRPPRVAFLFMLNILLVKARYQTPWAGLFSSVLTNIFPLHYLFRRFFGPHTRSLTIGDTYRCFDPHMVEAGNNVQFGYGCTIIAHIFDNRGLLIRKVKFGDNVSVGGETTIMPGVEMGDHSILASRSLVPPDTIIKPYEYWAGVPAKKIKDVKPIEN